MADAVGDEGAGLPSLSCKLALLLQVRRRADGRPWQGPTDVRAGLLALPGGHVKVDTSVSMIAGVINGRQANPGALLIAGLAALFDVPADYLLPPVCGRAVEVTRQVHAELLALKDAGDSFATELMDPAELAEEPFDWTRLTSDLAQEVKQIAGKIADELDLSLPHAEVLLQLAGDRARTSFSIAEIAAACHISRPYASKIADLFEGKQLLQRQPRLVGDRRSVRRLGLTEKARDIVLTHTQPDAPAQRLLDALSVDDLATMEKMLGALTGRALPPPSADDHVEQDGGGQEPPKSRNARGVA